MDTNHPLVKTLENLTYDLKLFIELSLQETDAEWEKWLRLTLKESAVKCWELKACDCFEQGCPAYQSADKRCWLITGTRCGGKEQGEFSTKYKHCTACEVYRNAVYRDPITEVYEHIVTLIHSLKSTQDKLKTLAIRDPLTGAYNRNFFNEAIANEIKRTKRYGENFSIVVLDIDNFKHINDAYGHLIGDWILKECATLLNKSIRDSDLLVRFGGDEFLVVTPATDMDECSALISRVHGHLAAWNKVPRDHEYGLSVSIGCSVFERGKDLMEVIKEADTRMYNNKLKQ
jgi:diguanylate cyclase (GGDEF)-like protein